MSTRILDIEDLKVRYSGLPVCCKGFRCTWTPGRP